MARYVTVGDAWIGRRPPERVHVDYALKRLLDLLPSGSGWDCGTEIDLDHSTGERLVLYESYHHMNDAGMYDGWTEHEIVVRPSLVLGIDLRVTGKNRNEIKEYLYEIFSDALLADAPGRTAKLQGGE